MKKPAPEKKVPEDIDIDGRETESDDVSNNATVSYC